ncbi:MAG: hypothetical protein ABIH86_06225 [Planctomycetota bacterium]
MRSFTSRLPLAFLSVAVCGLFALTADASSAGNRIKVSLADSPDVPAQSIEKGKMYDIQWGNLGQVISVRWTDKGEIELIGIVGDFSMSIAVGKHALSARVREAGRVRISNMSGVEVKLTNAGPSFSLKADGSQFDMHYDVFDTRPGETHFFEVYSLRLQRRAEPRTDNSSTDGDAPDFFLPQNRIARITLTSDEIKITLINPSVPGSVPQPETDKVQKSVVLGGRPSEE